MNATYSVLETTRTALKEFGIESNASIDLDRYAAQSGETTTVRATAKGLLDWCVAVENNIIRRPLEGAVVIAGFERLSRARFAAARYTEISAASSLLTVFGQADTELMFPVTKLHAVTAGPLTLEWFLVVRHESFRGLLSARDLDGFDSRVSPRDRRFEGVITHDPRVVDRVIEETEAHFPI